MSDLFGSGFDRFWAAWPIHPRKGAKLACKKKWAATYCETQADQICKHVEWLKTTEQWRKSNGAFIPAPLTYINQQRWVGAEIPEMRRELTMAEQYQQRVAGAVAMPGHIADRLAQIRRGQ